VRPASFNATLSQGDIVQVIMQRVASSAAAGEHRYLYEVDRIGKSRTGEVSLDLTHFPVDSLGRSLVALDVASATGGGIVFDTAKSGVSCDVNSDSDTTPATDDGQDSTGLPDDDAFDVILDDTDFGTGADGDGFVGGDGYGDGGSGSAGEGGGEAIDGQGPEVGGISPGGPIPGDTLTYSGCGCTNSSIDWYRDGVLVGNSATYNVTVADMGRELVGVGKCDGIDTCQTDPIPVPFTPTAYTYWRFKPTSGSASSWASTANSAGYLVVSASLNPGGGLWRIHSGKFSTTSSGAAGNIAQLVSVSLPSLSVGSTFHNYVGDVSTDPDLSTNFSSPGSWEFAFSNADSGPDAWDEQWGGADPP
jgi:hypothetical protein